MKKTLIQWLGLLCGCWIAGVGPAWAEEKAGSETVAAIGSARIYKNDMAAAREAAVKDGLAAAVDQFIVSRFPVEILTGAFAKYAESVEGPADAHVDQYKVLAESSYGDHYRVLLQVNISRDKLMEKMPPPPPPAASDQPAHKTPSVLFLVSEQALEDLTPKYWWGGRASSAETRMEAVMAETMKAAGFQVIAHGFGPPAVPSKSSIVSQPELGNEDALDIGRFLGADLVIVGKTLVYKALESGSEEMPSYTATITARAIRTDSGESLASILETAVEQNWDEAEGSQQAMVSVGRQSSQRLLSSIAGVFDVSQASYERLSIRIEGNRDLGSLLQFRKALSAAPGVKELQMTESGPDGTTLVIQYKGGLKALADMIRNLRFDLFTVQSEEGEDGTMVRARISPK